MELYSGETWQTLPKVMKVNVNSDGDNMYP